MIDAHELSIAGLKWDRNHLWLAVAEEHLVACYNPATGETAEKLRYPHEIWDLCPSEEGLWMMTGGGRLGRQLVLWSLIKNSEERVFNCPDGAGAGFAVYDKKLWLLHRHNRKLFCLDPENGKPIWVMRTALESFSPTVYGSEFWLIEADPGPLGHWNHGQTRFFVSRFDPARERVLERLPVSFRPTCMTFDGQRFWYSEEGKKGLHSTEKDLGKL